MSSPQQSHRLGGTGTRWRTPPEPPSGAPAKNSKLLIALVILVLLFLLALLIAGAVVLGDKALEALNLCWGDC